ncbi:MAG: lipopolysaccharide kinase InaA family protein [Burkholderiales bacterium]|nr:lipopolysaccharide kinase InaA family protein [Burkholderiales bacterium]
MLELPDAAEGVVLIAARITRGHGRRMARSVHLEVNADFIEALSAQGLNSFDDFMCVQSDDYAARGRTGSCVRLTLRAKGSSRTFYLKRHRYVSPIWKRAFHRSRARKEHGNLLWLRAHGFPTPEWIAWGEERRHLCLTSCFVLTAGIDDAQSLDQFLSAHSGYPPSTEAVLQKRRAIQVLADHVRAMHANGYVDRDLHFRNILIARDANGSHRFTFIDSPKGGISSGLWLKRGIRYDLASLNKHARRFLSRTDCLRFYLRYRGKSELGLHDRLEMARIEALSAHMRRKSERKRAQQSARRPASPVPGTTAR